MEKGSKIKPTKKKMILVIILVLFLLITKYKNI
jgi:hypothetical protein